jgi:ABC-type nitrate/sulfonate/bicarbonate transport system substrate-binding protein
MNLIANRYLICVLGVILLVLLSLPADRGEAGDATSVVKVHIPGYSTSSLPFLVADELGFYREEGIRIELTRIQTGSGIQALVAGAMDVSQIVGPTTLAAMLGGAPLKVVAVFNDRPTYKLYVKKQFRRFSDLKGARLGSTTPGSTNDRLLKVVLEKNGLDWRKDLSLIYIGLSEVMLKGLQSGAIDGTALTPPASFIAEKFGFHSLANFIHEVGALQGGVATNTAFLNGRREIAQRFGCGRLRNGKRFARFRRRIPAAMPDCNRLVFVCRSSPMASSRCRTVSARSGYGMVTTL